MPLLGSEALLGALASATALMLLFLGADATDDRKTSYSVFGHHDREESRNRNRSCNLAAGRHVLRCRGMVVQHDGCVHCRQRR